MATAALLLVVGAGSLPAQTAHQLTEPEASLPDDFGTIQTVRELPDGRVLVADALGGALYAVDLDADRRTVVGREGQGPDEYRQPDAVWPLPGDSTLLVDLGNGRLTILGPELGFHRTLPLAQGDFQPGSGQMPTIAIPQAVDRDGRIYIRSMPPLGAGDGPVRGDILRLPLGGEPEAVTSFRLSDRRVNRSGSAGNENVSVEPVPLSPEDAWGVAPDGSVVVVDAATYRATWTAPDGGTVQGPALSWEPVGIGTAEKEEWVAENGRSGGGLAVTVTVDGGRPQMGFQRGGAGGGTREIDAYTWPDTKPAVYGGSAPVDRQGRAWVRRHRNAGAPSTWDVLDRRGQRVGTVELAPGSRVVGFGEGAVYVASFDDFDLAYLERYALPDF